MDYSEQSYTPDFEQQIAKDQLEMYTDIAGKIENTTVWWNIEQKFSASDLQKMVDKKLITEDQASKLDALGKDKVLALKKEDAQKAAAEVFLSRVILDPKFPFANEDEMMKLAQTVAEAFNNGTINEKGLNRIKIKLAQREELKAAKNKAPESEPAAANPTQPPEVITPIVTPPEVEENQKKDTVLGRLGRLGKFFTGR